MYKRQFLTCVYLTDEVFDYKSVPLTALEAFLAERYESALVISEEMKNILAQVKDMPDDFPFETTIKTETFGKGRTKYVFT